MLQTRVNYTLFVICSTPEISEEFYDGLEMKFAPR